MDITWFNERPKDSVVTLTSGNLTLNKPASQFFAHAYSVMLGYNKDTAQIFIKPLNKEQALQNVDPGTRRYRITVRSTYARVTNKAYMKEMDELFQLKLSDEGRKYKAHWDDKTRILVVHLKEEM
ncbi:MAG: hypothetical protein WC225_04020 [Acholeplasmataceae bacterium]|nr:hypothetical protein [Acholeplasmataceae bacterium]